MRVDGKAIVEQILTDLVREIVRLKEKGVTPTLAVIQVGDDPASTAYIRQKQKAAERLGVQLIHMKLPSNVAAQHINKTIEQYNTDSTVHGIILQRPLPGTLSDAGVALTSILPVKDVDGFLPNSPYPVPVAAAVLIILDNVLPASRINASTRIAVIGRGETAGKPIAEALIKRGCNVTVVHSQTPNPDDVIRAADIVVSCVGKPNVIRRDNIKQGALLISVGIYRDAAGKLHGDYEEDEIKNIASFYTPTPGGVGPVNVACLMANLVQAANTLL